MSPEVVIVEPKMDKGPEDVTGVESEPESDFDLIEGIKVSRQKQREDDAILDAREARKAA